jgi:hypothetical protein
MADELKQNENILIKTDEQNILFLDPNSLVKDGQVKQRLVQHEKLMMYVNLEADIVPRSRVYLGGDANKQKTTITSLYRGNINFLKPNNSDVFDTSWTDLYSASMDSGMYASASSQNFGIRSINIKQTAAMIPQVSITFVDVRGKTLFESPENSPYKAFFHLPYPMFYLTVKGFYGKAIRYQLVLTNFNTRFDSSTGNYEVECDFLGPTAPLLSDIPIQYILYAPYMYPQQNRTLDKSKVSGDITGETSSNSVETTRGFEILKQVYDEYKANGIIPKDFPYMTVLDLAMRSENIDNLLEQEFFNSIIDPKILSDMDLYESDLDNFVGNLIAAGNTYLDLDQPSSANTGFYKIQQAFSSSLNEIRNDIDGIIDEYTRRLNQNNAFGADRTISKDKSIQPPPVIDATVRKNYLITENNIPYISIDILLQQINGIKKSYIQSRIPVEEKLNENINRIIKSKSGLGFEPTIRNIFAVILAGADTFIRLMSDVHEKATKVASERSKLIGDTLEGIYPFPQITKPGTVDKPNVLVYPGDISVRTQLKSYDTKLWPEVEFVEQYYVAAAGYTDALINQEKHLNDFNTIFPQDDSKNTTYREIFTWNYSKTTPYRTKTAVSVFYELFERGYIASIYSGLENFAALKQLAHIEATNIKESIAGVVEVEQKLKSNRNLQTLKNELFRLSPFKRWENTKDEIFTTSYLRPTQENDFDLIEISGDTKIDVSQFASYTEIDKELSNSPGEFVKNLYPIGTTGFYQQLQGKVSGSTLNNTDFSVNGILQIDNTHGLISNKMGIDNWYFGEKENIFKDSNLYLSGQTMNVLNTPYFTNALQGDLTGGTFIRTSYLFLNSLPFVNLYNKFAGTDKYVFASFNQYAATHKLPLLWVLKMGSIWHRYKNTDFLNVFSNNDIEKLFDGGVNNTLNLNLNSNARVVAGLDNNVGLYPKYFDAFYKGMHDGEPFFGLTGTSQSHYETNIQAKLDTNKLRIYEPKTNSPQIDHFTAYASISGSTYFLFPSAGGLHLDTFSSIRRYQNLTTRVYLADTYIDEINFSGFTAPGTNQHFRTATNDEFSLDSDYKKTTDLLATFKPDILDAFEDEFLKFAGTSGTTTMQTIIKSLCTLSTTESDVLSGFRTAQQKVCEDLSTTLMGKYFDLAIGNPKEVAVKAVKDFIEHASIKNLQYFGSSQVTTANDKLLREIIGEDTEGYYKNFFVTYNLAYDEIYFRKFRPIVRYYAGMKIKGLSDSAFIISVQGLANSYENKLNEFVSTAFEDLNRITLTEVKETLPNSVGFNDNQTLKLELWNSMKTFNDRWIGGNIIADKTLMNDFLFLDRGNRDIGQKAYINIYRLQNILNNNNEKMSLYSLIGELLQGAGFNFYSLPAYVNFFGVNEVGSLGKSRYTTSEIASDLFGTFLEVDYQNSSPKFLCQYVGLSSSYLNMNGVSSEYKFRNDGFDMSVMQNNPVAGVSDDIKEGRFDKSNRIVCFEANFGDQAQGVFKSFSLDQANIKNTAESYRIIEDLAKNNSGSNAAQVDIGLFNVYKNRNYTCEVTMMGNVMIQPTMYFQLRNVPMFEGAYLITEVRHDIQDNQIETTITGTRISKIDLPNLDEIMVSTNKIIYQRLLNQAKVYKK